MNKKILKKLGKFLLVAITVIVIVEFQKFMKARCGSCIGGSCGTHAWEVLDAQQLPLPEGAVPIAFTNNLSAEEEISEKSTNKEESYE